MKRKKIQNDYERMKRQVGKLDNYNGDEKVKKTAENTEKRDQEGEDC
jgi:hypothetical protein